MGERAVPTRRQVRQPTKLGPCPAEGHVSSDVASRRHAAEADAEVPKDARVRERVLVRLAFEDIGPNVEEV